MNEETVVIDLIHDNLGDYMDIDSLIVVFTQKTCNACIKLRPALFELPKEHTVIVVDCDKYFKSTTFMPGGIQFYPTIGLWKRGYFIRELSIEDINNKTVE